MTDKITGKGLVIIGASSGMGEATARVLAAKGAKLVLGARRKDRLGAIVADIKAAGGEAIAVKTDVTRLEDMQALVKAAVDSFGRIYVLFNNAGLMPLSMIEAQKVDEWNQMIDVNLTGTLYGVSAALPYMASVHGHITMVTGAVYCATKHAVRSLSQGLRQEVKPHNIRVMVIPPGPWRRSFTTTSRSTRSSRGSTHSCQTSRCSHRPCRTWWPLPSRNRRTWT
ncbi:NADP-dependent 3-hydroxy acid dehydrogenase YdfG [Mameliella alba]|uniref:SDR family oxidoreductase n=1 Tax=Mameliella alba TaxID=561184 RepID=UPI000886712B|nr:SDR family oxidoreductase [Mameliella alba]PTR36797.1 NADP-dependent 3-hydroxy acid dehydrogenase YdfG [Mameliella alba]GGF77932.1 oxidoreductase [Mameliella alba]SDD89141.1 NADP-dependent 3-hydroxy acid dehydrogenase YdfG [Mameliella alba]